MRRPFSPQLINISDKVGNGRCLHREFISCYLIAECPSVWKKKKTKKKKNQNKKRFSQGDFTVRFSWFKVALVFDLGVTVTIFFATVVS